MLDAQGLGEGRDLSHIFTSVRYTLPTQDFPILVATQLQRHLIMTSHILYDLRYMVK
jgi:hypothetical protein